MGPLMMSLVVASLMRQTGEVGKEVTHNNHQEESLVLDAECWHVSCRSIFESTQLIRNGLVDVLVAGRRHEGI